MASWGGIDLLLSTNPTAAAPPRNEADIGLGMATTVAAISIGAFCEVDEFKRRVDKRAREIRRSKPMPGVARIWLPGEQSRAKFEERSKLGVPIPEALRASLDKLARELKIKALGT